jgi:protein phosphatase
VLEAEPDADEILCLGDLIDYGPEPLRCVQWAIEHVPVTRSIQGNHDWAVGWDEDPRCSPPYRHLAEVTRKYCLRVLTEGLRTFLCELWPQRSLTVDGKSCVACHAAPSGARFCYLPLNAPAEKWQQEVELAQHPDFLFVGHTHLPGERQIGRTLVINPGSVGQPKGGDPRAAYALLQDGSVSLCRARYDIEKTVQAYAQTPLTPDDVAALAAVLRTGGSLPETAAAREP